MIKEQKQHLGLGAYRVLRYRAVVSHLHLVDAAYAVPLATAPGMRSRSPIRPRRVGMMSTGDSIRSSSLGWSRPGNFQRL